MKATDLHAFLDTLLDEHKAVGSRSQLKTLWTAYIRQVFPRDETPPPAAGGAGKPDGGAGIVRARAQTPPDDDH